LAWLALQQSAEAQDLRQLGVNLAGGEFGRAPGIFNKDYTYPGVKQFDYYQAKGLRLIRLPFKWERIQPALMGPLDADELGRLDKVVKLARERGLQILLDMHNYARYGDKVIGTDDVPNAAFADVWAKLAAHYRDEKAIAAYGIMNEPHDTKGLWPAAAQACVDAIRTVDTTHLISVCGDGWSGAHSWRKINNNLLLKDPANRLVYEAHQYCDHDNSGTYKRGYDDEGADPMVGAKRLQPFIEWLAEHKARGFIGEFGVPDNDPRWLVVLDNMLAEMQKHDLGGTYWAGGPWWNDYPLSVEPRDGKDRPQMAVLEYYVRASKNADAKPWIAAAEAADVSARKRREDDVRLGRRIFDFTAHKESYHYTNEGSEFVSEAAEDNGRKARKIAYEHKGNPAWIGVGVYFANLKCEGSDAFRLDIRSEKPCRVEVKAYTTDNKKFTAKFEVDSKWQSVVIPFADFKSSDQSLDATRLLQKIEFQPANSTAGNVLYLGPLRLCRTP
jgi:endoglucanase